MGVFEKLKNALFEEEYVEVEEKPLKQAQKKGKFKDTKKDIVRTDIKDKYRDEKPIAKKIVLPEKNESHAEDAVDEVEGVDDTIPVTLEKREFKMMEDQDLLVDDDANRYHVSSSDTPEIVKVIEKEEMPKSYENDKLYHGRVPNQPYGSFDSPKTTVNEYRTYETRREESTHFKPSPIISPIYGILDKNYKKEDVVPKREIRITSSYSKDKITVDDVREKAYGTTVEAEAVHTEKEKVDVTKPTFEVETTSNLLVDLSSDDNKPAVRDVTVGDATEYFEDLGLEYNVDYLDASIKASGRRVKEDYKEDTTSSSTDSTPTLEKEEPKFVSTNQSTLSDDDNLFDLIDSMYQDKE